MPQKSLTKETIVRSLANTLQPIDFVHAFWEGGAASFDRVDDWSDIDLYAVVSDDRVAEALSAIEHTLQKLSPIERKFEVPHPDGSGIYQAFYRLAGTSDFLLVDLAVLTVSAPDKYLEEEIHGPPVFAFNKAPGVRANPFDADPFVRGLLGRRERLIARMDLFACFVRKEMNRGNWIEAVDLYRQLVLDSLVEALRMRYGPIHYNFRTRYVYSELPPAILRRLEPLFFVRGPEDLRRKVPVALAWFRRAIRRVGEAAVRAALPASGRSVEA